MKVEPQIIKAAFLKGSIGSTEWWTEQDWENHRKNVAELIERGEFLKPVVVTVSIMPYPLFDDYAM